MNPARPAVLAATLLGLALAGPAHALSCDEILAMVDVGVPTSIVVQTIEDSGGLFSPEKLDCLAAAHAPEAVLDAARTLQSDPEGPVAEQQATSTESQATPLGDGRAGTAQGNGQPEEITRAIKLIGARKPLSASLALAEMLEDDRYPQRRGQFAFHMARALMELDMPVSAERYLLEVLARGPSDPYFDHALIRLIHTAERSDDPSSLQRVVAKIPQDAWPQRVRPELAYQAGLRKLEQGDLAGALVTLSPVPTTSAHGLQARYVEGVIFAQQGRPKRAVRAFMEVISTEVGATSRQDARRLRDLKNLALMDVARIHYGLELFERAEELYGEVERASAYWPHARLEMAWAQFMLNDTSASLGQILSVRSPYFAAEPFQPEANILRALNHFVLCDYEEVERILVEFEERVQPQQRELRAFAQRYAQPGGRQLADEAWATWFDGFPQDSTLTREIFDHLLRDRDLAAQVTRLDHIEAEMARIDKQKARWRDAVGPTLHSALLAERERTRRRAGLHLLAGAAQLAVQLEDLLGQSRIIRFEANDALRGEVEIIAEHLEQGQLPPVAEAEIPYALSADKVYWPFNGEFWEDELGSYVYVGDSGCR